MLVPIAESMAYAVAPETYVGFEARANLCADGAVGAGTIAALPPLVVEFGGGAFGDDVFAVGLA